MMDYKQYELEFKEKAVAAGLKQDYITQCLRYAKKLFSNNVPVIYNVQHLSLLTGYNTQYIIRATKDTKAASRYSSNGKSFYRGFIIPKKNGQKRVIYEPLPSLKDIQSWILTNILNNVEVSPFAKAYKQGVSISENLRFHKGQKKVLTIDICNFFPSINQLSIQKIFRDLGYSPNLSKVLSKLCCRDNSLPQGAPTSPILSNIYLKSIDDKVSAYCVKNKIRYTRYADDLSFSGEEFDENKMLAFVEKSIAEFGLSLNASKTKLMTPNMRQSVTGIVVNEKPQVVFHKRNNLRQEMYYIKKYGFNDHIRNQKIKQKNYLEHLLGKISFVVQINPLDQEFLEYKEYLINLKNGLIAKPIVPSSSK